MKKRRFLTPVESNELSRQVTQARLKETGVLAAAQNATPDPMVGKLLDAVKKASAPKAPTVAKTSKTSKTAKIFADEDTLKKLAGY